MQMNTSLYEIGTAALLGLATTSSSIVGASLGLYAGLSKRILGCILAFAAGALISALAIELGYQGAEMLRGFGLTTTHAWWFVSVGFGIGAIVYYGTSLFLEGKGAAVRYATRFREYALARKKHTSKERIELLAKCGLLRHLPPETIEEILPCVRCRHVHAGEIVFCAGDSPDALYIVSTGTVEVLDNVVGENGRPSRSIAQLGKGDTFGEMALLSGSSRTATVRAVEEADLLAIGKADFERLVASNYQLSEVIQRLSHERAISNLRTGGVHPEIWTRVASHSLDRLSRDEANKFLAEAAKGSGLAIVLGNILDTIPGCLVIGAKFTGLEMLSLTLMLGMFLGTIPEAAASAAMLLKAGYRPKAVYGLWSTVIVAGIVAAGAGKALIGMSDALLAVFLQAVAGGAVLGLVAHAMIPEAIDQAGSLVVPPIVAGFLFALYLALAGN
jgi:CRP-like cAMP-binding protein